MHKIKWRLLKPKITFSKNNDKSVRNKHELTMSVQLMLTPLDIIASASAVFPSLHAAINFSSAISINILLN